MLILLDGIDGCGKTTIAKNLESNYNFKVWHPSPPQKPWEEYALRIRGEYEAVSNLAELGIFENSNLVCDRFSISEYAYLEDFEETKKDISYVWKIDERLSKISSLLYVFVTCEWQIILERLKIKGELGQYRFKDRQRYLDRYEKYWEKTNMPKFKIDTSRLTIEDSIDKIMSEVRK